MATIQEFPSTLAFKSLGGADGRTEDLTPTSGSRERRGRSGHHDLARACDDHRCAALERFLRPLGQIRSPEHNSNHIVRPDDRHQDVDQRVPGSRVHRYQTRRSRCYGFPMSISPWNRSEGSQADSTDSTIPCGSSSATPALNARLGLSNWPSSSPPPGSSFRSPLSATRSSASTNHARRSPKW